MTRNLKALCLALLAAFALSAVAASSASASKRFHSHETNTTLTGTVVEKGIVHTASGTTECSTVTYDGTTAAKTVTEVTITPTYAGCKFSSPFGNLTSHLEMNGCHYVFTLHNTTTETAGGAIHTHGPTHIVCPPEKSITLRITDFFGFTGCLTHIGAQTPTSPTVDYKNEGSTDLKTTDILVTSTVSGITYTITAGTFGGECKAGTYHDGSVTGSFTLKGFKDTGEPHKHGNQQVPIWVGTA